MENTVGSLGGGILFYYTDTHKTKFLQLFTKAKLFRNTDI